MKRLFFSILAWSSLGSLVAADEKPETPLAVSIAVPVRFETRQIELFSKESHFHVVLHNRSDAPVRVWREWCSWGYFNLRFEAKDSEGTTWEIKKKQRGWRKNYPDFVTLEPGDFHVINVSFDSADWENVPPKPAKQPLMLKLRAVYVIEPDEQAIGQRIWTGTARSEEREYAVYR